MLYNDLKNILNSIKFKIDKKYQSLLNRIAVKSSIYKDIYNKYTLNISTMKYAEGIRNTLINLPSRKLLTRMFKEGYGFIGNLSKQDFSSITTMLENTDLIIVPNVEIVESVKNQLSQFDFRGEIKTVENMLKLGIPIQSNPEKILIFSSIWTRDFLTLNNLLIMMNTPQEVL